MINNKLKIITILGTRPEIIKLSCIIKSFDYYFNHKIINTGQNFSKSLNQIFFKDIKIREPDYKLNLNTNNNIEFLSKMIIKVDKILDKLKPDAIFILGDTNSGLSAYTAKRRKIPIFHYEAGNRCFDQRVPEEINRKVIDHMADINLTYSEISKQNLVQENFPVDRIIKVGSPIKEIISSFKDRIKKKNLLKKLKINKSDYFLISIHREENTEKRKLIHLLKEIKNLSVYYKKNVVFSLHPRTLKVLKSDINKFKQFKFLKPFNYSDYIFLQKNAFCVISDSGSLMEESSILNFSAISLRDTTERAEGMEEGVLVMSGFKRDKIINGVRIVTNKNFKIKEKLVRDYNVDNVSEKIVSIITSYTDYVNNNVWKKNVKTF